MKKKLITVYDDIFVTIPSKFIKFKVLELGQILHVDKSVFSGQDTNICGMLVLIPFLARHSIADLMQLFNC